MGYGAMQLGGANAFGPPADPDRSRRALRTALELGVRHVDTSDYYGPYLVNELIRDTLSPYPEDLVLVTKIGGRRDAAGRWLPALSPPEIRAGVHDNLKHLGVDRLDVVNLRVMTPGEPVAEKFAVLAGLREQGLIRHLGVSNVDSGQLAEARRIAPVVCVQNMYSVGNRADDALVDECAAAGHRVRAVLPARRRVRAVRDRPAGRGRPPARRRRAPGRAGLAAGPLPERAGHPRQLRPGARRPRTSPPPP